jgi:two-component system, LytTR family, response regulator
MIKTVIIDDDLVSQEALKDVLHDLGNELEIVGVYSGVEETLANLPGMEVDILFLDMELQDGQGFDVLKRLEDINFEVIITTMHDSFMLEAIKHSAIDYLFKPVSIADLSSAISRFESKVQKLQKLKRSNTKELQTRLVIPNQDGLELVEIKDLVRLQSDGAYTKLYLEDGRHHLTSKNLGHYEDRLKVHDFFRVHHQHLISLNHIKKYMKGDGGSVTMSDNSIVDVSRRKKEEFLKKLLF